MRPKPVFSSVRTLIILFALSFPHLIIAQTGRSEVEVLQDKIHELNQVISQLEASKRHSDQGNDGVEFTTEDKLSIDILRKQQRDSRIKIDAISLDIINISEQLTDRGKRTALAKKMRETKQMSPPEPVAKSADPIETVQVPTARTIDLAAIKRVRNGKSLDQARLLTIEELSLFQVQTFYRSLPQTDRFELYDLADEIVATDATDLETARRSAIYFYLFAHR